MGDFEWDGHAGNDSKLILSFMVSFGLLNDDWEFMESKWFECFKTKWFVIVHLPWILFYGFLITGIALVLMGHLCQAEPEESEAKAADADGAPAPAVEV